MAISADVLATALQELQPEYSELFTKWHPLIEKIVKGGNFDMSTLEGPYREFVVTTGGPGKPQQIYNGDDLLTFPRRQNSYRGNTYAPRFIYGYNVPAKDLAEANGKMDFVKILKKYPEMAMADFLERIAAQLGRGASSVASPSADLEGVAGFLTLNGDQSYFPQSAGTARTGAFEFSATQNDTVFGLAKEDAASGLTGWKHQYAHITSFGLNGKRQLRKVYHAASRQGASLSGGVDLMLSDEESWLNYVDELDTQVEVPAVTEDKTPKAVREGISFMGATWYIDDAIDISDTAAFTTAAARQGVIYGLNTDCWHAYSVGHDASMETKGLFATRPPIRLPNQEVWRFETVLSMGMYCDQLRSNFVATGGATV